MRRSTAALIKLSAAGVLATVPWIATPLAESSNNWSDADGDGMLDGFVNGSYDWFDINASAWLRIAGFLAALVIGTAAGCLSVASARAHERSLPTSDRYEP